jgi:two-component system, LytTR family, response regulator
VSQPSPARHARANVRVLIVDDEPLARQRLRAALRSYDAFHIVGECEDGLQAVEAIHREHPDLVLLDVQMPGLDGFAVMDRVGPEFMPFVVFVTAHDAYALRAFEAHAIDYILKPFEDARLSEVLERARRRITLERDAPIRAQLVDLIAQIAPHHAGGETPTAETRYLYRLTVRDNDRIRLVPVADIDWLGGGGGNYVKLHVGTREYRMRESLGSLMERLDPRQFARIHKSTIVNLNRIAEVQAWFGGDYIAILRDGKQLRVSRTYAASLLRSR